VVIPLVHPHPSGTSPQPSFACRLHVGPGLRLHGFWAQLCHVGGPFLSFALRRLALRFVPLHNLHVFCLIIKHVSFKTYKHQNLRNSLVINPILSSVFRINGFYVVFWQ